MCCTSPSPGGCSKGIGLHPHTYQGYCKEEGYEKKSPNRQQGAMCSLWAGLQGRQRNLCKILHRPAAEQSRVGKAVEMAESGHPPKKWLQRGLLLPSLPSGILAPLRGAGAVRAGGMGRFPALHRGRFQDLEREIKNQKNPAVWLNVQTPPHKHTRTATFGAILPRIPCSHYKEK